MSDTAGVVSKKVAYVLVSCSNADAEDCTESTLAVYLDLNSALRKVNELCALVPHWSEPPTTYRVDEVDLIE